MIFAVVTSIAGSAFCFTLAGAILSERPGESSADEMLELFQLDTIAA